MTDVPCESAILNSYDDVEELSTAEGHALSVIAEEEEDCDRNAAERLHADDDATIDKNSDSCALRDAEVTLMSVKACSPVKHDALAVVDAAAADGENSFYNAGDNNESDVTESMPAADSSLDKDIDVGELPETSTVCLSLPEEISSEHTVADTNDEDNDEGSDMKESVPSLVNGAEYDLHKVSTDNTSDINEDDCLDVMGNTSNIDDSADKDVDVIRPSDEAAVYLEVNSDVHVDATLAADVCDPSDDDNDDDSLDLTPSMSDAGSDVGRLSDTEEEVHGRHDSVPAVSPQLAQSLLTNDAGRVGDVQPEESLAGRYCLKLIFFFILRNICLLMSRVVIWKIEKKC